MNDSKLHDYTEKAADPSVSPEQHIIDTDTAQELWNLVAELPPRGRSLLQALFTDAPGPTRRSPTPSESRSAALDRPALGRYGNSGEWSTNVDSDTESEHDHAPVPITCAANRGCPLRRQGLLNRVKCGVVSRLPVEGSGHQAVRWV